MKRDTARLDAERVTTELGPTLVATAEQTILDLARRPAFGGAEEQARQAVRALFACANLERINELAASQRMRASLRRAQSWVQERKP